MKISSDEKDFGVIIDSGLTFDKHIMSKVKNANNVVGLIVQFCVGRASNV